MRRPEIPSLKCQAVPFLLLFLPITPSPLPKLVAEGWVVDGHWCPSRPQQLPKLQPSSLCYQDCSEKPIIRQPWSDSALIQHWAPQGVGKSAFSWFSESVNCKARGGGCWSTAGSKFAEDSADKLLRVFFWGLHMTLQLTNDVFEVTAGQRQQDATRSSS